LKPESVAPNQGKGRQLGVVVACAVVFVVAIAARRNAASPATPSSTDEPLAMSPLPSGAPIRDPAPTIDDGGEGCHFPDRGFGDYAPWKNIGKARALVPASLVVGDDGGFPLLVHFHGGEAVRRELAPEHLGVVIAAVDAGVGSGAYGKAFTDPRALLAIVEGAEDVVAKARDLPSARAWPIILSSWSAGYGAVRQVLGQKTRPVNGVVLLDSLYASYLTGTRKVDGEGLTGFVAFARAAAVGDGPAMFLVHSGVPTPSYASTAEVGTFLLGALGLDTSTATAPPDDPLGLTREVDQGRFHLRAYAAGDRDAHCGALRFLKGALREQVLPAVTR
jgi:hypothetical protein